LFYSNHLDYKFHGKVSGVFPYKNIGSFPSKANLKSP
jgi:hypothetical protein